MKKTNIYLATNDRVQVNHPYDEVCEMLVGGTGQFMELKVSGKPPEAKKVAINKMHISHIEGV